MDRASRSIAPRLLGLIVFAAFLIGLPIPARAQLVVDETSKTVDGLIVYIGFLPAELLKERAPAHTEQEYEERQMHGGIPSGKHDYHLVVVVFDAKTGDRVGDATVFARISPLGFSGKRKLLEPMAIAQTTTYGEFFDLPSSDSYVLNVEIRRPRVGKTVKADFTFHHKSGSHP